MITMKSTILAAALAAASLSFGGAANAAPVGAIGKAVTTEQANLQQVHYRSYRHNHRRYHRNKYRNRGYGYYRGYRPGVSLYIGPRYGHRHHRRWR